MGNFRFISLKKERRILQLINKYLYFDRRQKSEMFKQLKLSPISAFQRCIPEDTIQNKMISKSVLPIALFQQLSQYNHVSKSFFYPFPLSSQQDTIFELDQQSDVSQGSTVKKNFNSPPQTMEEFGHFELKKTRKNKVQTKKEIAQKKRDQGRGGNCIASNITKTLFRIIQSKLKQKVFHQLQCLSQYYKIKSQKQNTIILVLLLYVFLKQGKITKSEFEDIFEVEFLKSLRESRNHCEKKMEQEKERRDFHHKNKKMYSRFIQINTELFQQLSQNQSHLDLQQIEKTMSDTYDRKQRQVQKAMSKIKSIILNHNQLKILFQFHSTDVLESFLQSINYAYRRNLPKRSNQAKAAVRRFVSEFEMISSSQRKHDKYVMCFLALRLVGQKEKQIWQQFINNLTLKSQFNQTSVSCQQLRNLLQRIPYEIKQIQNSKLSSNPSKIHKEPSCEFQELYDAYLKIKENFQI